MQPLALINALQHTAMRFWLKITACLLVLSCTVQAALPPEAQEAFDQGVSNRDKGLYLDAIASFEVARQKALKKAGFDAPEIYQKLGETEEKIPGRELRAICWFAACLSVAPAAENADRIKKQIASLKQASRDNLWRLMQVTENAGRKVAEKERAADRVESSLDTVVALWSKCGGYTEAKKVVSEIEAVRKRAGAYSRVSGAQVEAGDFDGAWATFVDQEKAAELIDDDPHWDFQWRDEAHTDLVLGEARLAEEQAKAGDMKGAQASIAKARQTASHIFNTDQRSRANSAVAVAQALVGDIRGSQATVSLLKTEAALAEYRIDAQVAIAEAQMKAGDLAGARATLVAVQQTPGEIKDFGYGRKNIELAPVIAELDRASSAGLDKVYRELCFAQAHAGDGAGVTRTAKLMDLEARKSLSAEFSRREGYGLMSSDELPVLLWLQEIKGTGWEMDNGLEGTLFTDYFHYMEALNTEGGNADQSFSGFERAVREMQIKYSRISQRLKNQFGL